MVLVHAWGDPLDQHCLQVTFKEGLLALSLDSILGEMIDTKEWTPQPPPERSSYYMTADHEAFVFLRITFTK